MKDGTIDTFDASNQDDAGLRETIRSYLHEKDEGFDDPFYIIDLNKVIEQYNKWQQKLPNIKPYFAIKSNPDLKIIRLLSQLGCNFDCASKSEIATILNIVDDPKRIIFANPCKISSHIAYARYNNVDLMTFDCIEELEKIHGLYSSARLLLRISVDDSNSLCKFNSKFGCVLDNLQNILERARELQMNLVGFSFHVGSGCQDAGSYYSAIRDCKFAYLLANRYGFNISIIDIGGGFPGVDKNISFDDICCNITKALNDFFKHKIDKGLIQFIAEPGRFFTEATHTLVLNVIAKKQEVETIKYYLNDGVYGSFNCIYYDHQTPTLIPLKQPSSYNLRYNSTFFGPTCDSMDVIYKNISFPELNIGDWLYIKNYGSYTCSPSTCFNGFSVTACEYIYPTECTLAYDNTSYGSSSSSSFSF